VHISLRQVVKKDMVKLNLTQQEELLMKRVCELQLDSFERILSGQGEFDIDDKLKEHQVSEPELKEMITQVVRQYMDISHKPESLFHDHTDLLVNFRDALDFNIESLVEHSNHISTLLSKLDYAMFISQHKN
jgi:hypothetical protein